MKKRNKMLSLLLAAMLAFQTVPYAGLNTGNEPVAVVAQAAAKKAEITNVNTKTLTIEKGEVFQLKANRTDVKWKSSNKNVVTVSKTGKLKGKNGGAATVTLTAGKTKASLEVTVGTKVAGVNVIKSAVALPVGARSTIKAEVSPADASNLAVTYQSAKPKIASVSKDGVITAKKAGSTKITVQASDGSKKKETVYVTVRPANSAVRLQDDFYQNINAQLLSEHTLAEDENQWGNFYELNDTIEKNLGNIIDGLVSEKDQYAQGSTEQKIIDFYMLARDMDARDKAGIEPLRPYIEMIDQAQTVADFVQVLAQLNKAGVGSVLSFAVQQDIMDSSQYMLVNNGPVFVLTKDYMQGEENSAVQQAFLAFIQKMFVLAGETEQKAAEIAGQVFELQKEFALNGPGVEDQYNVEKMYNVYTKDKLASLYSNCDIEGFLKTVGITNYDKCIVYQPDNAKKANGYLTQEHLELLKNYTKFNLYMACSSYLTSAHYKAGQDFNAALLGPQKEKSADVVAKGLTQGLFSWEFGKLYTERYFSEESKKEVEQMTQELLRTFRGRLQKIDWISDATKQKAIKKLDTMKVKIGYPDKWPTYLDDVSIDPAKGMVENILNIQEALNSDIQELLDSGVDKEKWMMTPQTVNAGYSPLANDITFPAGILQAPFYDKNADHAQNLGGIGTVIGHEITHAFDTNGAGYDENGNYVNWWTQEDLAQFTARADKVKKYYSGIEVANGIFQNGDLTVTENIADMGAMACVLEIVGDDKEAQKKVFESNAKIWAENQTDQLRDFSLTMDVHSLGKVRVNAVLPLFDQFYDVYNVTKKDAMYVAPEDRVQIW